MLLFLSEQKKNQNLLDIDNKMYSQTGGNAKWAEIFICCLFLVVYHDTSYFPLNGIS